MVKNKKMLVIQVLTLFLGMSDSQAAVIDPATADRLKPVGTVCLQGQPCAANLGNTSATPGARTGAELVNRICTTCHGTGLLNAPKIGDASAWSSRAEARGGLDGLLKSAIHGLNAMPAKGTCADCSEDELKGAIQYMSGLQ